MKTTVTPRLPVFPADALRALLPLAFAEDVAGGDITSMALIPSRQMGVAKLTAKETGVLAGLPLLEEVFRFHGFMPSIRLNKREGDALEVGDEIAFLEGPLTHLLVCERIVLNFMQRLAGIASRTRRFVDGAFPVRVLDTRKTLPGFRALDKYAVAVGGGVNHRMGLFDQVLIKDNHIDACGGAALAVSKVRERYGKTFKIECEVRNLPELEAVLTQDVDRVLLDNFSDAALRQAVEISRARAPRVELEASGNMTLERVSALKGSGLDFISVGALTHSVPALDISMTLTVVEGRRIHV